MRIPAHLRLSRHGIYYFRIVVPLAVRPAFGGRPEIKASLGTRNLRIALGDARKLAIEAYGAFEKAKSLMTLKKPVDPNDPSTWPTVADRKYEATIETPTPHGIQRFHIKADPDKPDDIAAAKATALAYITRLDSGRAPSSPEQAAFFAAQDREIDSFLAGAGVGEGREPEGPRSPPAARPESHPVGRSRTKSQGGADHRLSALWERFKLQKHGSKIRTERAKKGYDAKFKVFVDWFGDAHILDVTPEDISQYKDYLLSEYQPQAGKKVNKVGLDATTVDNYVGVLNGLYKWARANGSFPRDMLTPTTDQRIMSRADKKARAQSGKLNRAFKPAELVKAFDPQSYRAQNTLSHHYWPPLIALFTGMRLGEVSQLACSDIYQEDGLWVISINDEDYKRVKSAASRRTIPMHPELVTLGLPQFAQDVRSLDLGPQLFPVLRPISDGEWGNAPGKKWDRYLQAVGLTDPALTYHSFRRTAATLLKRKKVPFDVRCQMVGHELDHVNELYATDYTVGELAEMIFPVFLFDGLDLSGLVYRPQEFNEAIQVGFVEAVAEEARRKERLAVQRPSAA